MLGASLLFFLASATNVAHAANRFEERIDILSEETRRFLQEGVSDQDLSMALYAPCYPCGPSGFTTTPDVTIDIPLPADEAITCSYLFDGFVAGMVPEQDCPFAVDIFSTFCGCAANPTISPAPSISSEPSVTPSTSPSPTVAVCYLCGTSNYVDIDYDKYVTLEQEGGADVFFGGGEIPCFILNDPSFLEFFFFEGGDVTCSDIQAFGKACGCPPLEPTISPAPTSSVSPSSSPSSSPAPSAAPCLLCGEEDPYAYYDYEKEVNVASLGGMIPCFFLEEIVYFGPGSGFFEDQDQELTCDEVQAYGKECGCPMTEPTISPFPSISPQPTVTPTASPAPTAPCSCESICDGHNRDCDCWCDHICKDLGDCCGDVTDYCDFSDYDTFGDEGASPPGSDGPIYSDVSDVEEVVSSGGGDGPIYVLDKDD